MKPLVFLTTLLFISSCQMFHKEESLLFEYKTKDGNKITIYYVTLGATTDDVIQVRESDKNDPLWTSKKYNYLKSSEMTSDTTLRLVVGDTGLNKIYFRFDTVTLRIK